MSYQKPIVQIVSASREGDVATIRLKLVCIKVWPAPPLMPGGLYEISDPSREVFQLHKLMSQSEDTLIYETYDRRTPLPTIGLNAIWGFWWTSDALQAVIDQDRTWVRMTYPDDGSHVHCLLTWETISAYQGHAEGYYFEPEGDWITVEAYETYIVRDILRLRQPPLPFRR